MKNESSVKYGSVSKDRTYLFIARTRTYPTFWSFFVRTYLPTPTRPFWPFIRIFFCVHLNFRDRSLVIMSDKHKCGQKDLIHLMHAISNQLVSRNIQVVRGKLKKIKKNVGKIRKKMFRGRVGVGHSLPEPTDLKHCQNTYRHLPTGRSRSDP